MLQAIVQFSLRFRGIIVALACVLLVYGVYVVLMGTLGLMGARRRHHCSMVAAFAMSGLSCLLAIPPFIAGLLVTVPDTFRTADPKLFTAGPQQEPYSADIVLAAVALLELVISVATCALGCSVLGGNWKQQQQHQQMAEQEEDGNHNNKDKGQFKESGGGGGAVPSKNSMLLVGNPHHQGPIFTTSVNITHPSSNPMFK